MIETFDAVVIGAGSVGVPAALALQAAGLRTVVLEKAASTGQGQNKAAIGGIRATHSEPAKIRTCLRSLEIFSTWRERHGDDIHWRRGGYSYPVYRESDRASLQALLAVQKAAGLGIDWLEPGEMAALVPGIEGRGLLGGTYAPGDGSASPLLSDLAFARRFRELGGAFRFRQAVTAIESAGGRVAGVAAGAARYAAPLVVNAAGAEAAAVGRLAGDELPVAPDCHEGGITEPVARFLGPMVVDIRPAPGSKNFYFYQSAEGQIVFCVTPDPPILGTDRRSTSAFLPMVARRMVELVPRLARLRVRRIWRGLYPNSPDGSPIVDRSPSLTGLIHAVGMCGQGYMLGPGLGELVAALASGTLTQDQAETLRGFRCDRPFTGVELLK